MPKNQAASHQSGDDIDRLRKLREIALSKREENSKSNLSTYIPARDELIEDIMKENIDELVDKASADGKFKIVLREWSSNDEGEKVYGKKEKMTLNEISKRSFKIPREERLLWKLNERMPYDIFITKLRYVPEGYEQGENEHFFGLFASWSERRSKPAFTGKKFSAGRGQRRPPHRGRN